MKYFFASIFLIFSVFASAKTFDTKENRLARWEELNRLLNIPIYFGIPRSATARNVPNEYETPDELFYYEHPKSTNTANPIGLRLYITERSPDVPRRLAASGFIRSGDVLVSFRPDWGKSGPYTQAQMGQTHAGLAYVKDGQVLNVEHPLDGKFLLPNNLTDIEGFNAYKRQPMVHIFRPRFLYNPQNPTDPEAARRRANFDRNAELIRSLTPANPVVRALVEGANGQEPQRAAALFPIRIGFQKNYLLPKVRRGETQFTWVKDFGEILLDQKARVLDRLPSTLTKRIDVFCSELATTVLALANCDLTNGDAEQFTNTVATSAACVQMPFKPLPMVGDYLVRNRARDTTAGLGDGPLMIIDSMNLADAQARNQLLLSVFNEAEGTSPLSEGQVQVSGTVGPSFVQISQFYTGIYEQDAAALALRERFNMQSGDNGFRTPRGDPLMFLDNYAPTVFGINSYLPDDNDNRAFDYVGTLAFTDSLQPPPVPRR